MIPSILHNDSALTSDISPRTSASPAKFYWGIDQSIRYGSSATIMANTAGIIDTGKKIPSRFLLSNQAQRGNSQVLRSFIFLQMLSFPIDKLRVPL